MPSLPACRSFLVTVTWMAVAALGTACRFGETTEPGPPVEERGALVMAIDGLPTGVAAQVAVNGPGGYFQALTLSGTLSGLTAGTYTVTIASVTHEGSIYAASPTTYQVTVAAGATVHAPPVSYNLTTGFLSVSFAGLPGSAAAQIRIVGPQGYNTTVSQPQTIAGLLPGTYSLEAYEVVAGGATWAAAVPIVTVVVAPVLAPASASFAYALASGALTVNVSGLPGVTAALVRLAGPGGFTLTLTGTTTITNMAPGTYTITPDPVSVGADVYRAPGPVTVQVPVGETPVTFPVTYTLATGRLTITSSGLPQGAPVPSFQVSGPGGYAVTAASGTTLAGLTPGAYSVTAPPVSTGTATYLPAPAAQAVTVPASATPVVAGVAYALGTGSLLVSITGLPVGAAPSVVVSGPGGFSTIVETSTTLHNLTPGTYTVTASSVTSGVHAYAPSPAQQQVAVQAVVNPAQAPVAYAISSGLLSITVSGLPNGVPAAITVTGPGGYQQAVAASVTLSGLVPGVYQVTAAVVVANGTFSPSPPSQNVGVSASVSATSASVAYAPTTNSLTVIVSGLTGGVPASVTVAGPGGYSATVQSTQTLVAVPAGTYTITASSVKNGCVTFAPDPLSQLVTVNPGASPSATVHYTPDSVVGINLCIAGAYLTQSVQTFGGAVPLVAGRNGLLRVFAMASIPNADLPQVRVRFYKAGALLSTVVIPSPGASVPLSVDEGNLGASWNATVSGALLQPGLSMLVDVDPANQVAETSEADNLFPASGTAAPLDIRTTSTLNIRFVPVIQQNGDTGRISEANRAAFVDPMLRMFPVAAIDADLHAAYVTFAPQLQSNGNNWSAVLNEINTLRVVEGATRYYYGVVRVGPCSPSTSTCYTSGVAGLGYIGLPAAIGWDYPGSGPSVMAHELGHNFGRYHAPCGGPSGVDPAWPHATHPGAQIGNFGYDIVSGVLKSAVSTFDLMSYCDPEWISDYTYRAIQTYRAANPMVASARIQRASSRGLLVWGRIDRGQLILEPAFEVDAPATLPARPGPHRLEVFGTGGETLYSLSFAGDPIADAADPDEQTFAFVIPVAQLRGTEPARLRFSALGRQVERRATGFVGVPSASRPSPGRVRLAWNQSAPAALIRNARTGQVLAVARGGAVDLVDSGDELDVTVSDGVRSVRTRLRPR